MPGTRIAAIGHYQPARVVTNAELETMVETTDEWITQRVGIRERRWAAPEETVADMAFAAAQDLLAVLDRLQPQDSGGFWAYDGQRLPW